MITQLSLFDFIEEKSQEETILDPHGRSLPLVIYKKIDGWADGDISPSAMERLALVALGETISCYGGPPLAMLEQKYRWHADCGMRLLGYERYYYRCVATGIVNDQVYGAYVYESCLMDLARDMPIEEEKTA